VSPLTDCWQPLPPGTMFLWFFQITCWTRSAAMPTRQALWPTSGTWCLSIFCPGWKPAFLRAMRRGARPMRACKNVTALIWRCGDPCGRQPPGKPCATLRRTSSSPAVTTTLFPLKLSICPGLAPMACIPARCLTCKACAALFGPWSMAMCALAVRFSTLMQGWIPAP